MPKTVNFGAQRERYEKEGLVPQAGGGTFKVKEGANRIRLISECLPHPGSYKGKPNFKWLCRVIDRADGAIKAYFMPNVIYDQIVSLQGSEDYAFDSVPMPYDIQITAEGAGTKEVKYTVIPARKNTPLTPAEEAEIDALPSLEDMQKAIYDKVGAPAEPVTHSDEDEVEIPFSDGEQDTPTPKPVSHVEYTDEGAYSKEGFMPGIQNPSGIVAPLRYLIDEAIKNIPAERKDEARNAISRQLGQRRYQGWPDFLARGDADADEMLTLIQSFSKP